MEEQLSGQRLGKYQVIEEIGRGGMGTVYRAYDPLLDRYVAIKVLAAHLSRQEEFVQRFMREARAAARIKHPNVVTIHDVGQDGNHHYLVMEYLEGSTLRDILRQRGSLPSQEAISILRQMAEALDCAHQEGVFHRDVKPGNVIVTPRGRAVLTDFGLAKAAYEGKLTVTGMAVGSPEYMATEQVAGGEIGPWTDIYGLGVVAYEVLAGRTPFAAESVTALLYQIVYQPPIPLSMLRPDLPEEATRVLERALSKEPQARYPSAAAFVQALEQALGLSPAGPAPKPVAAAGEIARPAGRLPIRPWIALAAGVLILVLSIVLMRGILFRGSAAPPIPSPTATAAATAQPTTPVPTTIAPLPSPPTTARPTTAQPPPASTATPWRATATPPSRLPTTPLPPAVVPTATPLPPTVPTATPLPPTVPTATPLPPTVPTATPLPPTVPTATPLPPTVPTATPLPPTATLPPPPLPTPTLPGPGSGRPMVGP